MRDDERLQMSYQVGLIIQFAMEMPLDQVEEWAYGAMREHVDFDTLGSIMDPTRWMREHEGKRAAANIAQAFLAFRKAVEANRAVKP